MQPINLSVIVPVYNEASSIEPFLARLIPTLTSMQVCYEVIFCLDPSSDNTEQLIKQAIANNPAIKLIILSRRFGQAAATMAGLEKAKGEYAVTIDVDLQDPPELIEAMYAKGRQGFDVVYSRRIARKGEPRLKKLSAFLAYKLLSKLTNKLIPFNCGDYRLLSQKVVKEILAMQEKNPFLRGLIPYVGYQYAVIDYHREKRNSGKTKYNRYFGSIKMGLDGVWGFSTKPLTLIFFVGFSLFIASMLWFGIQLTGLLFGLFAYYRDLMLIAAMAFFSSLQLLALSLISEYLMRIYNQSLNRPLYIIDKFIDKFIDKTE
jgi:dolichol-phosphate mannosyltransferase